MAIQITGGPHFVPGAYLKYFSDKKGSGHYNIMALPIDNLKAEAIVESDIKSICYNKNLYTLPGNSNEEKMLLETFYADQFENNYEDVYRMLTNPEKNELSDKERELAISTIATMFYRVPVWQKQHIEIIRRVFDVCMQACKYKEQKEAKIEGDIYPLEGKTVDQLIEEYIINNKSRQIVSQLNNALKLVSARVQRDNLFILKLDHGKQSFITSDNPFILQNSKDGPILPFDPSNIMKLPLDSKHYLILVPGDNRSGLNKITRHCSDDNFGLRQELISNTRQFQGAHQYILGNNFSLTRFLDIKD